MTEWIYNDPTVADEDILYRRVPKVPQLRTYDSEHGTWVPTPAAFRRDPNEGMSSHLRSIVTSMNRDPESLYPAQKFGSVEFEVCVPRRSGAGVLPTDDPGEDDPCLRAAHAEVRPPHALKNRDFWKTVANEVAAHSRWVQSPV